MPILLEIAWKLTFSYERVGKQHKKTWVLPIAIGAFEVKLKQDIFTFDFEWDKYPLEEYNSPHPFFDNIGMVQHLACK